VGVLFRKSKRLTHAQITTETAFTLLKKELSLMGGEVGKQTSLQ